MEALEARRSLNVWLVFGATGQLGRCLQTALSARNLDHRMSDRRDADITDPVSVTSAVERTRPTVIVNTAAWTDVDAAEDHEHEALAVNRDGARHVAEAAARVGATLVHVSTDYVFAGTGSEPIPETAGAHPLNVYGRTKWHGEEAVRRAHPDGSVVVRTAWLYSAYGRNFARTMAARALGSVAVKVVDDQHGTPTSADDLAHHIIDLVEAGIRTGTHHGTNAGTATWFAFAREIYRLLGAEPGLVSPVATSEHPTPAARPAWSVLGHEATVRAGVQPMRDWVEALADVLPRIVDANGVD